MIDFGRGCAVVTGGSSGLGRGLAFELAERGMPVVIVGRNGERAETVAEEIRALGVRALGVSCDVSDRAAVTELARTVREEFGSVELLALNAAVTTAGPLVEHTPEDWDWVLGSVFLGVVNGVQAFLGDMISAGRGHVLITASMVGLIPDYFVRHGPYASAKSGVIGLGVALRPELEGTGVSLSILTPAGIDTPLAESYADRPAVKSGAMSADENPHPFQTVLPDASAPALSRDLSVLTPREAARRAIDGVQADELFIITHPEFRPVWEDYNARILRAFDASDEWERKAQSSSLTENETVAPGGGPR